MEDKVGEVRCEGEVVVGRPDVGGQDDASSSCVWIHGLTVEWWVEEKKDERKKEKGKERRTRRGQKLKYTMVLRASWERYACSSHLSPLFFLLHFISFHMYLLKHSSEQGEYDMDIGYADEDDYVRTVHTCLWRAVVRYMTCYEQTVALLMKHRTK